MEKPTVKVRINVAVEEEILEDGSICTTIEVKDQFGKELGKIVSVGNKTLEDVYILKLANYICEENKGTIEESAEEILNMRKKNEIH